MDAERAGFLKAVRDRLHQGIPTNSLRPLLALADPLPTIGYSLPIDDLPAAFCSALEAVGGKSVRLPNAHRQVVETLSEICREGGALRAVISFDPECAGLVEALRTAGVAAEPLRSATDAALADIGITGAAYGIALTGSIVVDASRAGGRTASLLPPMHVALVKESSLRATPGDVFATLATRPQDLPSNLVLITGPSRSSDIEMQLTLGVHGPRTLVVLLLDDTSTEPTAEDTMSVFDGYTEAS